MKITARIGDGAIIVKIPLVVVPRIMQQSGLNLSRRQTEVLEGLNEGLANKEIANKLNISERAVKFHVSNLFTKFKVNSRIQLMRLRLWASAPQVAQTIPRTLQQQSQIATQIARRVIFRLRFEAGTFHRRAVGPCYSLHVL